MRDFFESLSLSGGVIAIFTLLIFTGVIMQWRGNEDGEKVWSTFGTALTTFVSGKKIGESEILAKQKRTDQQSDSAIRLNSKEVETDLRIREKEAGTSADSNPS